MNKSPRVWNSQLVAQTLEKLRMGMDADLSCFHHQDIELKTSNLLYQLTEEEVDEFDKCSKDIVYFVEQYCKFLTDKGRHTVNLRPYQKKILRALAKEKFIEELGDMGPEIRNLIMLQSRQSGKTTTIAAFFAWYMCFHTDRNLAILANKQATAFEIVNKVTTVFKGLPFYMKPGIENIGAGGMRLDNGCYLTSQATTKTAQIGFTIHVLYADEFAHILPNIADDFWRSVYPTLASSDISQCIISSTPNGIDNVFFEIWDKCQKGLNDFYGIRVDWWEVPGHDEEWAKQMIANFGEDRFNQEFGLDFNTSGSRLLLDSKSLKFISKIEQEYIFKDLFRTDLDDEFYENLKWHPDFDPNVDMDSKKHRFVLSIDTGEGKYEDEEKDNDYNICDIFQVVPKSISRLKKLKNNERSIKNMFRLVQVGLYRDNIKDEEICALVSKAVALDQFKPELCKVLIEMNFNGKYFLDKFSQHENYEDNMILHTHHTKPIPGEKPPRKKPGFKVGRTKDHYCKLGRKMVRDFTLILNEKETSKEFKSFGKNKKGQWKGLGVHDDIAMSAVNTSHLYEEPEYEDWLYDFLDEMEQSDIKKLMLEILEVYDSEDGSNISDETFKLLYEQDFNNTTDNFTDLKNIEYTPKYSPSISTSGNFGYPW